MDENNKMIIITPFAPRVENIPDEMKELWEVLKNWRNDLCGGDEKDLSLYTISENSEKYVVYPLNFSFKINDIREWNKSSYSKDEILDNSYDRLLFPTSQTRQQFLEFLKEEVDSYKEKLHELTKTFGVMENSKDLTMYVTIEHDDESTFNDDSIWKINI